MHIYVFICLDFTFYLEKFHINTSIFPHKETKFTAIIYIVYENVFKSGGVKTSLRSW